MKTADLYLNVLTSKKRKMMTKKSQTPKKNDSKYAKNAYNALLILLQIVISFNLIVNKN